MELVMEGQAWRIGDGMSVCVKDRWIGVTDQERPTGHLNQEVLNWKVDTLIDHRTMTWRRDLIDDQFEREDARRIKGIPLSITRVPDKMIWRPTTHGLFTVKSAYHLAVAKFSRIHDDRASPSMTPAEWKKMWRLKIPPRVKMFLWRACRDALPSKVNLVRRGYNIDPVCAICGEEEESISHIFLGCKHVVRTWYTSMLRIDMEKEQEISFKEFVWSRMKNYPAEYVEIMAFTAWEIWKMRCGVCMEGRKFDEREVAYKSQMQWQNAAESNVKEDRSRNMQRRNGKWRKPDHNTYKLNCDVAVVGNGRIGLGFVIRDEQGNVILAGKKEDEGSGGSTLLEGIAMRFGLQMTKQYGLQIASAESDNKSLIEAVNGKMTSPKYCDIIIEDIRRIAQEVNCRKIEHIPREHNQVAHHAAAGADFLSFSYSPAHLLQYVLSDSRD